MNNKPPCRNYGMSGTCTFGSNCRFDHYTETPLVDPPTWIFSCFNDIELNEFSYEEMRAYLHLSFIENKQEKFTQFYDNLWLENFKNLSDKLTHMCMHGVVTSDSERIVDYRKMPEIFCKPFNANLISQAREQSENEPMEVEEDKMWGNSEAKTHKMANESSEWNGRKNDGKKHFDGGVPKRNYSNGRDENRQTGRSYGYGKYERGSGDMNKNNNDVNDNRRNHSSVPESKNTKKESLNSFFEPEYKKKE